MFLFLSAMMRVDLEYIRHVVSGKTVYVFHLFTQSRNSSSTPLVSCVHYLSNLSMSSHYRAFGYVHYLGRTTIISPAKCYVKD